VPPPYSSGKKQTAHHGNRIRQNKNEQIRHNSITTYKVVIESLNVTSGTSVTEDASRHPAQCTIRIIYRYNEAWPQLPPAASGRTPRGRRAACAARRAPGQLPALPVLTGIVGGDGPENSRNQSPSRRMAYFKSDGAHIPQSGRAVACQCRIDLDNAWDYRYV
jgi:hypothetical protein